MGTTRRRFPTYSNRIGYRFYDYKTGKTRIYEGSVLEDGKKTRTHIFRVFNKDGVEIGEERVELKRFKEITDYDWMLHRLDPIGHRL